MRQLKAFQILEASKRVCTAKRWRKAENRLEEITSAPHYCERGYSTKHDTILFGNWNDPTGYTNRDRTEGKASAESAFFAGVAKALETCAELEWSDEWATCNECGGAVRTSADSYQWQRGFVELDGEILCSACARKRPTEILESFENEDNKCLTADLGISPGDHEYLKIDQQFENGFYGGQDASPPKIAAALRERGITRFVFLLDSVGQFDLRFSVWVHLEQRDLMPDQLSHDESACAIDPAEGLKRALQSVKIPSGDGITYSKLDATTGTSETRKVSPEEFIRGIGK